MACCHFCCNSSGNERVLQSDCQSFFYDITLLISLLFTSTIPTEFLAINALLVLCLHTLGHTPDFLKIAICFLVIYKDQILLNDLHLFLRI